LLTTSVGAMRRQNDVGGCRRPLVGDVKEVADLVEQTKFAFFLGDVFADHDHAILGSACCGPRRELSNLFGLQAQGCEFVFAHDGVFAIGRAVAGFCVGFGWLTTMQGLPSVFRQIVGDVDQVGLGIESENEADAAIVVPAVEMFGLREIGVATQENLAKACAEASATSSVQRLGGALMRRTVARPIDKAHDFAGVGERDEQRMIPPDAIVGDADALFVFGVGGHQGAVRIKDGAVEKVAGLMPPDADANIVIDLLEGVNVNDVETSAEVARGGGIGNALGSEGVEEVDIVAAEFNVLEAIAVTKGIVGQVKDVVGFMVRHMNLEEMKLQVNSVDESDTAGEEMKDPNTAVADAAHPITDFVVDVAGGEDRTINRRQLGFVKATLNSALVSAEPSS
jgi:hypothetical protein